jgi:ATP synthase, delta/epsilon chain, beta-sandwich domain protein
LGYTTMDGEEHTLDIQGGFVEMSDGTASVCVS